MRKIILVLSSIFLATVASAQLFDQNAAGDNIYVINDGSFDQSTGAFTRSGTDNRQGVVASFGTVNLDNEGDFVEATFDWTANGNNTSQPITFGFFDGAAVTADGQTSTTDNWTGYFHSYYNRTGTSSNTHGVGFQGTGTNSLFNHADGTLSAGNIDGNYGTYSSIPGFNDSTITLRLERLADDKIQLTTQFQNDPGSADSSSGTLDGIDYDYSLLTSGAGTITSTYDLSSPDFSLTQISGISLAQWKTREWANDLTLNNLVVSSAIPEPSSSVAWAGVFAMGWIFWRRRR